MRLLAAGCVQPTTETPDDGPTTVALRLFELAGSEDSSDEQRVGLFDPDLVARYRSLPFGDPLPSPFAATSGYGFSDLYSWVKVNQ